MSGGSDRNGVENENGGRRDGQTILPEACGDKVCPRCRSYYAGKIPVLNYTDERFLEGLLDKPPTIMTPCHGVHPVDPYDVDK